MSDNAYGCFDEPARKAYLRHLALPPFPADERKNQRL